MKACVLHAVGDIRFEDVPAPSPGPGEVLLKIMASGICGSDIPRVYVKGTYRFPTIPGHEFAGRIAATGKDVDPALAGKKAAVFPLLPCRKCAACLVGEYAQCENYDYFGSRRDGGFAEYVVVPGWNLVMVPDSLTYEEAAMTEPAAVAVHALRQAGIEINDNVVIFGAGPIGLLLAQWAAAWGAGKIMLIDIDAARIAFAKKLGFENVWNAGDGTPAAWIKETGGGRGADVAVEGTGVSAALEQCLECARPFGRIVAMGNPAREMKVSQQAWWYLLRKQLKISGTWNSSFVSLPKNDWTLAVQAMESGRISVKPGITHRFSLAQCRQALEMMKNKTEFFNKVMFVEEPIRK